VKRAGIRPSYIELGVRIHSDCVTTEPLSDSVNACVLKARQQPTTLAWHNDDYEDSDHNNYDNDDASNSRTVLSKITTTTCLLVPAWREQEKSSKRAGQNDYGKCDPI
jgi:hypothetical protein